MGSPKVREKKEKSKMNRKVEALKSQSTGTHGPGPLGRVSICSLES